MTDSEAEERMEELARRIERARDAIVKAIGPWRRGMPSVAGQVHCPVCSLHDGLHYRRAGSNGHIAARCEEPGCVSWIE